MQNMQSFIAALLILFLSFARYSHNILEMNKLSVKAWKSFRQIEMSLWLILSNM